MTKQPTASAAAGPIPQPSKFLIFLALLFVPGVYILLLACAAAAIALVVFSGNWALTLLQSHTGRFGFRLAIIAVVVAAGALLCVYGVLKGLIATIWPRRHFEPAVRIELGRHRGLGHLVASLCSTMNTRIPDAVILHCDPVFFVTQSKIQVFNGVVKGRILAIGLPMLGGLTKNELRAIIAHEFAHFTGADTLYSSLAYPVYTGAATAHQSMDEMINGSESLSLALPMMMPRFVLDMFLTVFHFIDMKLSRQREARADAVAASVCGSQSFKVGLMKVCGISGIFGSDAAESIIRTANDADPRTNYHTAFRKALPRLAPLANSCYQDIYAMPENPFDSHPSLKRRLDALRDVPERYNDTELAASLLTDIGQQEEMLGSMYAALTEAAGVR